VLVVLPASEQPAPVTLDRLAHEYSFKDELDSAWAARPLELVRDRGRTILVLEDPRGKLLGGLLGAPMEVGDFLRLAAGVTAALRRVAGYVSPASGSHHVFRENGRRLHRPSSSPALSPIWRRNRPAG
jgi:hypothetical protein